MKKISVEDGLVKYSPFIRNTLRRMMPESYMSDYDELYQMVCEDALELKNNWLTFNHSFPTWIKYYCRKQVAKVKGRIKYDKKRWSDPDQAEYIPCGNEDHEMVKIKSIIEKLPHPHIVMDTMNGLRLIDMGDKYNVDARTISYMKAENKKAYKELIK